MTKKLLPRGKSFDSALEELGRSRRSIGLDQFEEWLEHYQTKSHFHFALMAGPYLSLMMRGIKRVESRFSKNRGAPFRALGPDDIVIFQSVGGQIEAFGLVEKCLFFEFSDAQPASAIISQYEDELQLLPDFIERKKDAAYATLIWFKRLVPVIGPQVVKGDRRGWVPLCREQSLSLL
jgi:hypothetical protein